MIDFSLSPLTWLLCSLLAIAVLRRHKILRRCAGAIAILAVVLMTPLGANALVGFVESRAPSTTACAANPPSSIVVLGAGLDHAPRDENDVGALSSTSLRRLLTGVAQYRKQPGAHLYLLGASAFAVPESVLYERLAERLGVPTAAMTTERTSMTTWQNAQHLAALSPRTPRRIGLVTSALHGERAMVAFRANGFEPCPIYSESDYLPPGDPGYFLPRTSALHKADAAIHEIVGDLAYQWRAARASTIP